MHKIIFTKEQEQAIIDFYLSPQSLSETALFAGIVSREPIKQLLAKYNIPFHSKEMLKKIQQQNIEKVMLEKYGSKNAFQVNEFKEKAKETKLNRYGLATYHNIEKTKLTNIEKYGVDNPAKADSIKQKIAETNLQRYGVACVYAAEEIRDRIKLTCQERYGCDYAMQNEQILAKANNTMLEKYGVMNYAQTREFHLVAHHRYKYENETFDSFPELCVYLYCLDNNINVERHPCSLSYFDGQIMHKYFPDFRIDNELVEIKGEQFLAEDGAWCCPFDHELDYIAKAKYECAIANSVKILYTKDYQQYVDWFKMSGYDKEDFRY